MCVFFRKYCKKKSVPLCRSKTKYYFCNAFEKKIATVR